MKFDDGIPTRPACDPAALSPYAAHVAKVGPSAFTTRVLKACIECGADTHGKWCAECRRKRGNAVSRANRKRREAITMIEETIGANIKRLRKARDWSQQKLANELHRREDTVAAWEAGRNEPRSGTIKELCQLFDVTYEEIMGTLTKPCGETKS